MNTLTTNAETTERMKNKFTIDAKDTVETPNHTKAGEVDILRQAIAALGPDSYIGPWLTEQLPFIESDLRSDIRPLCTLASSQRLALEIVQEAKRKHDEMIEKAQAEVKRCEERRTTLMQTAYDGLRNGLRAIEAW